MANVIQIAGTMPAGGSPKAFWSHVVGLVLIDMRERGWTGGLILDATWKDGLLSVTVGPGHGKVDVKAVADFIEGKRRRGNAT
jgi:hypothetical protein